MHARVQYTLYLFLSSFHIQILFPFAITARQLEKDVIDVYLAKPQLIRTRLLYLLLFPFELK